VAHFHLYEGVQERQESGQGQESLHGESFTDSISCSRLSKLDGVVFVRSVRCGHQEGNGLHLLFFL
jgi:hypothetical protein